LWKTPSALAIPEPTVAFVFVTSAAIQRITAITPTIAKAKITKNAHNARWTRCPKNASILGPLRVEKRNPARRGEHSFMALNAVNNTQPAGGRAAANFSDSTVSELNTPAPAAPPGSIGHQLNEVKSQLVAGNLGGIGVGFGLGVALDAST
jgi:hypothetical protein